MSQSCLFDHEAATVGVAWHPSDGVLASGCGDHTVRICTLRRDASLPRSPKHSRYSGSDSRRAGPGLSRQRTYTRSMLSVCTWDWQSGANIHAIRRIRERLCRGRGRQGPLALPRSLRAWSRDPRAGLSSVSPEGVRVLGTDVFKWARGDILDGDPHQKPRGWLRMASWPRSV